MGESFVTDRRFNSTRDTYALAPLTFRSSRGTDVLYNPRPPSPKVSPLVLLPNSQEAAPPNFYRCCFI